MYGTIARMKTKEGALEQIEKMEQRQPPGFVAIYVLQMDSDPDELYMVALFDSQEAYLANAESPLQDQEYRRLRARLAHDPEWHDGQVVFSSTAGSPTPSRSPQPPGPVS